MMQTGDEYFDSNEFRDILTAYEESVSSGAPIFMDTDDLVDIADYYTIMGYKDKADEAVETALELSPGATLPLVYKAREALAREDVDAAKQFANAILDKQDCDYKYLQAEIMVVQDKIDEAEDYLKNMEATISEDEYDDFIYDVTNLFLEYGVFDKALEWLEKSPAPDNADLLDMKGRALIGLGRYKESLEVYDKLIDINPRSIKYWNHMGNAQFMTEDYNSAMTSSEFALALDPGNAASLLLKAKCMSQLGNNEGALEFYRRYNDAAPKDGHGELQVGIALLHLSRYDESLAHLKEALQQSNDTGSGLEPQLYEMMAFAYTSMGKTDDALDCVRKIDSSDDGDGIAPEKLVVQGHVLLESGRTDEAEAIFRNAIIRSEYSPAIILRVIVSILDNKYTEVAYRMFKMYFMAISDPSDGYAYMALCCWELKKGEEFIYYFKKAMNNNPTEASAVMEQIIPKGMSLEDFYNDINNFIKK